MTLAPAQRAHLRQDVGLLAASPLTAKAASPSTSEPPAPCTAPTP
jgi:hypothetical protein